MATHQCPQCKTWFETASRVATFCSVQCRADFYKIPRGPCPICGKPTTRARQIHCSKECHSASLRHPRTLLPKPCEICGTIFQPKKDGSRRHCSKPCAVKAISRAKRKPGGVKTVRGYIVVSMPGHPMAQRNGYVMQHRLIMAEYLGRSLLPTEAVHHINETTTG